MHQVAVRMVEEYCRSTNAHISETERQLAIELLTRYLKGIGGPGMGTKALGRRTRIFYLRGGRRKGVSSVRVFLRRDECGRLITLAICNEEDKSHTIDQLVAKYRESPRMNTRESRECRRPGDRYRRPKPHKG